MWTAWRVFLGNSEQWTLYIHESNCQWSYMWVDEGATIPFLLGWACSFPSTQQACRSFFRIIYVGGPLRGPQSTATADTLIPRDTVCFL